MPSKFTSRYGNHILLILLYISAVALVNPTGEFPLNDDCTYTKSVITFVESGQIDIGEWPAMSLLTNILWGGLLVKIFGFSFFILRLSTMLVALAGTLMIYSLVNKTTGNRPVAMVCALTIMFNPYFFHLSNTFMTDVNFTVMLVAGTYALSMFFHDGRILWVVLLAMLSAFLVLLRQYGLILPFSFLAAAAIFPARRCRNLLYAGVVMVLSVLTLWVYEIYLAGSLRPGSSYQFVFVREGQGGLLQNLALNFGTRVPDILLQLSVYLFPLSLLVLHGCASRLGRRYMLGLFGLSLLLYKYVIGHGAPILPNIVTTMNVGPDTFYETVQPYIAKTDHTHSHAFEIFIYNARGVAGVISGWAFLSAVTFFFVSRRRSPLIFVCGFIAVLYTGLLIITPSFFDRYHLPLIAMVMVVMAHCAGSKPAWLSLLPIVLFAAFGIAGTHDYFNMNRKRWEAYNFLKQDMRVPADAINAGFEPRCWDSKKFSWMWDAHLLDRNDYLIQYGPEVGFERMKAYPFRRLLVPEHDTVFIFRRIK